jgi:hypothetical protein
MANNVRLSLEQINKLKHAVGLNNIRSMPKNGIYSAYRNFFSAQNKDIDWEELVKIGYATCQYVQWCQEYCYCVSTAGLRYLEGLLDIKIEVKK